MMHRYGASRPRVQASVRGTNLESPTLRLRTREPTLVQSASTTSISNGTRVTLDHVTQRYGAVVAADDVSLEVHRGELLALLGPSGCGKTTLLRIVAGLLRQTDGHVSIGSDIVDALPPNERGAGIVFQNYALFPHMTVAANVAYGLRARGVAREPAAASVIEMLKLVRLEGFDERYPRQLSGGQQQRVALARTLAVSPKVLLLDEPFGALDKNLRLDMQIEVKRLQRALNITTIMVTHDQEEALSMADRIAVMNQGRVEQLASPDDIYDRPATLFVASFVGTANLLRGQLRAEHDRFALALSGTARIALPSAAPYSRSGEAIAAIRPEQITFCEAGADALAATVKTVLPLGPSVVYDLALAAGVDLKLTTERSGGSAGPRPGDTVHVSVRPNAQVAVFPAR